MSVLIKLLPELAELIEQIGGMEENQMQEEPQRQSMPEDNMGALANVT
jgi:hypothetical protein